ncbi:GAF domain-containing protein [Nocardioides sp. C4-1]|uniref:GAF domain-containing protein n=1 Tax=Nocardioides sp. C4-1 TaxID=3151851 RepID=UPI0032658DBA
MPTYRAPMRSRRDDVDPALAVRRALDLGLCGIGGVLRRSPSTLPDAVSATADEHGPRAADRLARFAAADDGDTVWTRDEHGLFHVGELAGSWGYDDDPRAVGADLVHVRRCRWRTPDDAVPGPVLATFGRGGRNFQRIRALP